MKSGIAKLLLKYKLFILGVLGPLGIWGAGVVAFVDSASIPVPTDAIMIGYIWHAPRHLFAIAVLAGVGSALGGLVPFYLGRAGGELFLLRRIDRVRYEQLLHRFEKQEFLAMLVPSMLPPPTPWKLFVFAAGVFEMPVWNFMLAVLCGRFLRTAIEGVLVIRYGPQIAEVAVRLAHAHARALLMVGGLLLLAIIVWVMRKVFRKRRRIAAVAAAAQSASTTDLPTR